jgi:hypothetical protein
MFKRVIIGLVVLFLVGGIASQRAAANPPPLPPLPSQTAINSVIAQSNGATFTPMGVPTVVTNQLATFTGVFSGAQNMFSAADAVHYISTTGALLETVIPLNNSRTEILDPIITTPGSDPRPGKIVGAVFQPSLGVMIVVAVFKPEAFSCPNCEPPEKVRFYYNSTQYYEYSIIYSQFLDPNGDALVEPVDAGAAIAHKVSCVTVGLEQVCWEPYSYSSVRQEPTPKDMIYNAYTNFKDLYDLSVDFYVDDAVPDLLGQSQRNACASQLASATSFGSLASCLPNLIISASKEQQSGQPIAIFVLTAAADVRTYDTNGTFIGGLPAGQYLVIDATPNLLFPGTPTVSFLVNANGVNHYLIPSVRMQGFGLSPSYDNRQAGIRDGFASYHGWGR